MGATVSKPSASSSFTLEAQQGHMGTPGFGLWLSSHEEIGSSFDHGLTAFRNKAAASIMDPSQVPSPHSVVHHMMSSLHPAAAFEGSFDEAFEGMLGAKREGNGDHDNVGRLQHGSEEGDVLTRDFLGLRPLSHTDILNMTGMDPCMNPSSFEQLHNQKPWPAA